ncbi:hypothetical protein HYY69_05505 [Candidatus Woesearchaeota archaeon]|nr:hypothetical protein [Candidatus Woesearchaeota archaeon]
MGIFRFFARDIGYLKTIHSNREIDRLIVNRLRELEIQELKALRSKKENKYHNLISELHKQVQLLESIEFYIKVKFIRILENNKSNMQQLMLRKNQVFEQRRQLHKEFDQAVHHVQQTKGDISGIKTAFSQHDAQLKRMIEQIDDMIRVSKDMTFEIKKTCRRNLRDFRNVYYNA